MGVATNAANTKALEENLIDFRVLVANKIQTNEDNIASTGAGLYNLKNKVQTNKDSIASAGVGLVDLQKKVKTNKDNIASTGVGLGDLQKKVKTNKDNIASTGLGLGDLQRKVQTNKDNIASTGVGLSDLQKKVKTNKDNIASTGVGLGDLQRKVKTNKDNIASTGIDLDGLKRKFQTTTQNMASKTDLQDSMDRVSENSVRLGKLSQRGAFCGYQNSWTSANSVITYDKLLLSEGDAGTLDASSGVWTTNVPGIYQVTWSLINQLTGGDDNGIYLYRNGREISESKHVSYIYKSASSSQVIGEQGGRTMLLRLDAADTLSLRT